MEKPKPISFKVIIVGAGLSGLLLAHLLTQANIDFVVLEAHSLYERQRLHGLEAEIEKRWTRAWTVLVGKIVFPTVHDFHRKSVTTHTRVLTPYHRTCFLMTCSYLFHCLPSAFTPQILSISHHVRLIFSSPPHGFSFSSFPPFFCFHLFMLTCIAGESRIRVPVMRTLNADIPLH